MFHFSQKMFLLVGTGEFLKIFPIRFFVFNYWRDIGFGLMILGDYLIKYYFFGLYVPEYLILLNFHVSNVSQVHRAGENEAVAGGGETAQLELESGRTVQERRLGRDLPSGRNHFECSCGLPISTYFSATKLLWLLENVEAVKRAVDRGDALFGTVDTWLIWNMNGGVTRD
ncbi:hypothetical protein RND81_05G066600 [Saponaria officinalis]|uniref:glycerol kinase n=1 Tax=Saponaria officinalis TaxID=3572 RepID=A0AAW1KR15_SAPOF